MSMYYQHPLYYQARGFGRGHRSILSSHNLPVPNMRERERESNSLLQHREIDVHEKHALLHYYVSVFAF